MSFTDSGIDDFTRQIPELSKEMGKLTGTAEAEKVIKLDAEKRREIVERRKALPMPEEPKLPDIPERKPNPPIDPMEAFGQPATLLAIFGSLLTRAPLTSSLNAAAGAMNGYAKGNIEAARLYEDQYRDQLDQAISQGNKEIERYREALLKRDVSISDMQAEMEAIAAENQDQMTLQALKAGNVDAAVRVIQTRETLLARLQQNELNNYFKDQALQLKAREVSLKEQGVMDDDALNLMVEAYQKGFREVVANIGRGAQGATNIANFWNKLSEKMKGEGKGGADLAAARTEFMGLLSEQRTLGTRAGQIGMGIAELQQFSPLAISASDKVDRTEYPTLNSAYNAVLRGTGDTNIIRFIDANNAMINAYAQIVSRGNAQLTDAARASAQEVLRVGYSKGQYAASVDQLNKEAEAAQRAPGQVREQIRSGITGTQQAPAATQAPSNIIRYDSEGNRIP